MGSARPYAMPPVGASNAGVLLTLAPEQRKGELLADARSQITSVNAYIESLRDFWLAQSDLDMALIGKAAVASPTGPAAAAVDGGGAGH